MKIRKNLPGATVSPYDDEVVDPYAADPDGVKNPHEESGSSPAPADEPVDEPKPKPTRARRATSKAAAARQKTTRRDAEPG